MINPDNENIILYHCQALLNISDQSRTQYEQGLCPLHQPPPTYIKIASLCLSSLACEDIVLSLKELNLGSAHRNYWAMFIKTQLYKNICLSLLCSDLSTYITYDYVWLISLYVHVLINDQQPRILQFSCFLPGGQVISQSDTVGRSVVTCTSSADCFLTQTVAISSIW